MKTIELEENIERILRRLQAKGKGYIVGGYVRDKLLGIAPGDCDFCTDLSLDQVVSLFRDCSPAVVGKAYSVVKITLGGQSYDIARMRKDVSFTENRKITGVEFVSDILEDLRRRDFTVNAIAFDGKNFLFGDPLCEADIASNTIRFIGPSEKRIEEDPLRMLRAVRILVEKGMDRIDPRSLAAICANAGRLSLISKERIRDEFTRILCSSKPKTGFLYLIKTGLIEFIAPELLELLRFAEKHPEIRKDVLGHTLLVLEKVPEEPVMRLAALFHDCGKPAAYSNGPTGPHFYGHERTGAEIAKACLENLRYSGEVIRSVTDLVREHLSLWHIRSKSAARKLLNRVGVKTSLQLIALARADITGSFPPYDFSKIEEAAQLIREVLSDSEPFSLKDLAINGRDLRRLGFKSGPEMGSVLQNCLDLVLENPEANQRESLLEYAIEQFKKLSD
ncbi:MAG: CCA tRNA nucleotidyltransferase [Fusobacteriaceae bacterium]|jgi:tRNA nucleotidyltransferase (CCA-adding enzyme)|nr:CCA tRNA nucleotidyltransferase [Fusobacteriaceae bacterium]